MQNDRKPRAVRHVSDFHSAKTDRGNGSGAEKTIGLSLPPFYDIHHHLVWGIDADGPKTFEESCEMARAAARNGVIDIVTTPHVMPGIRPFDREAYLNRLSALQQWCVEQGLELRLHPGGEIFYTPMTLQYLSEGRAPTMNGGSHVLVEFDIGLDLAEIRRACEALVNHGYTPIIAHCERYRAFVKHPRAAMKLRDEYALALQVNCGALLHPHDFWTKRFISVLLAAEAVDCISSDAHNTGTRPVLMEQAYIKLSKRVSEEYRYRLFRGLSLGEDAQ